MEDNKNVNVTEEQGQQASVEEPKAVDPNKELKFSQEDIDKILNKKFAQWKKKEEEAKKEAEELSRLSEADRQRKLFEKEKEEFEATRKAFEQEKLLNETVKQLASRNLPIEFADILKAQDAESTLENINKFEEKFNAALEAKVNDRLKGNTPKNATNKSLEITKEAFKKMSLVKQAEIAKTKPELYKKLTER